MTRLLILAIIQSSLLALGQVFLKIGLQRMAPFGWTREFWGTFLVNWQFALCGVCFGSGSILWMYMIKHFPLSMAYPLGALSYVMCTLLAVLVLHETVEVSKWIGIGLIMAGCALVGR